MPINYESALWRKINAMMGTQWWAVRIESPMTTGVPDVLFAIGSASGWLELKSIEKKRPDGSIKIATLTDAQISWLHHGNAWLLVEVRDIGSLLLIEGCTVKSQEIDEVSLDLKNSNIAYAIGMMGTI